MISQDREQDIKCFTIYLVSPPPSFIEIFLACIGPSHVGPAPGILSVRTSHSHLPLEDEERTGPEPTATCLMHRGRVSQGHFDNLRK